MGSPAGLRRLYETGYDVADNLLVALAQSGSWVQPNARILDFGCGAGDLVYRLRDLGFEAFGFDLHERVNYRKPEDREWFGFTYAPGGNTSNTFVENFQLPFTDRSFDVVFSTSVLEHVLNLEPVIREIARVTDVGGCGLHVVPRRSILIEPHTYVPLGARWQSLRWLKLMAMLGIRNEFQGAMNATETAENNALYMSTGLSYVSDDDMLTFGRRYFLNADFVDKFMHYNSRPKDVWKARLRALKSKTPIRALSMTQHISALYTAYPHALT